MFKKRKSFQSELKRNNFLKVRLFYKILIFLPRSPQF